MYRPRICSIELFRKCCLRCRMCYMWKAKEEADVIGQNLLYELADQLQEVLAGAKEVVFSGGEPLLYENIVKIIEAYSQKGLKVGMASNGVLINQGLARQLVEAGLKNIQLSFDSCNKKTHDFLRGVDGAHEKVLKAAEYLSDYKGRISVCAQTVISGANIDDIIDTIKFVRDDQRFDVISFMAVTTPFFAPIGDNWQSSEEFSFLWPDEKINRVIDEIIVMKKEGWPIANPISQFELFRAYFNHPHERKEGVKCLLGDYVLSIDPKGEVRLCCFMQPIGNVKKQPLIHMLDSKMADKCRKTMHDCDKVCNTIVNCFFQDEK